MSEPDNGPPQIPKPEVPPKAPPHPERQTEHIGRSGSPPSLQRERENLARPGAGPAQPAAYSPPPSQGSTAAPRARKPWILTTGLVAAASALALAFIVPQVGEISQPTAVVAPQSDARQLRLDAGDIDSAATEYAKQLIVEGRITRADGSSAAAQSADNGGNPFLAGAGPIVPAERKASVSAASRPENGSPPSHAGVSADVKSPAISEARKQAVRKLVERAPKADLQRIAAGKQVIYKVRLIDSVDEDGDVVDLFVNNVSYGAIPLMHVGAEVMVTLPAGTQAEVKVVARADGEGGVTFGAQTSQGEVRTRVMEVGESDSWTATAR